MIKLKFLNKQEAKERFVEPINRLQTHNIIPGKFRSFHYGHRNMIIQSNQINHFVLIGKNNLKLRHEMLLEALEDTYMLEHSYRIYYHPSGYIPSIAAQISEGQFLNITCGSDRYEDYKRQFRQAGIHDINFLERERLCSSSEIIDKIKNNKFDSYDLINNPWLKKFQQRIKDEY